MSSEQPGGGGHALSPGPARRGAGPNRSGLPPPGPPASHLGSSPPRAPWGESGRRASRGERKRAAEATCWGLEAA